MVEYSYAKEKIFTAVEILAISPGDVRSRLVAAFMELHPLEGRDFPPDLRSTWAWIRQQLTRYGPVLNYKGEVRIGSVQNTMNRIQNRTGTKIAKKIYTLYQKLALLNY